MRKLAFALVLAAVVMAALAPAAAAEQLHANVVSWAPADVEPRSPVAVVLELYVAGPSPYPAHGTPVAGVNDVEVVLRGDERMQRFDAADVGGGHYGVEITFPEAGEWDLRVRYGPGRYGRGDEIMLGKGAIRIDGAAVDVGSGVVPRAPLAAAAAIVLVLGLAGPARIRRRSAPA
jgi:hypothetical protein